MKKILFVASKASHFRNFHIPYIRYTVDSGNIVFTVSADDFEYKGSTHVKIPFKKKFLSLGNIGAVLRLTSFIRRERFDVLYTNSTLAGAAGRLAAILSGCKKTKTVHICHGYLFSDDGGKRSKLYLAVEKLLRKRTDLLAVMNKEDLLIAKKYSLGNKIVFIDGMGLDTKKFPLLASDGAEDIKKKIRKSFGADENTILFLCAAEFSERKSQKTIIKALPLLKRTDYKVIFAGDGGLINECKALADKLDVAEKTVFLGHYDRMNELYRVCDFLISASRFEGLPFNVMEALYCGENIIVSDVKGNSDLAKAVQEASLLFPFGDFSQLASLMDKVRLPESRDCKLPEKYFLENIFEENLNALEISEQF